MCYNDFNKVIGVLFGDMIQKVKSWLDKPMSLKVFYFFIISAAVVWLLDMIVNHVYDTDMYWLIATGREILSDGIPYTNPWTIDSNISIIVQQWLYAIILAGLDKIGSVGFSLFLTAELAIFLFLIYRFFKLKNLPLAAFAISAFFVMILSQTYVFLMRPELITMIIVFAECLLLEYFQKSGKWMYLAGLPILMILEMNLHASMWPIHYAILAAYIVPAFYIPPSEKNKLYQQWKPLLIFGLLMTASMFLNPYGLDGILYIVKSFLAHTFDYIAIIEMQPTTFFSGAAASIFVALGLLFLCIAKKTVDSTSVNIAVGFIFMAMIVSRNSMFMVFPLIFLFRDFCKYAKTIKIDWIKDVKNSLYFLFSAALLFLAINFAYSSMSVFGLCKQTVNELSDNSITDSLETCAGYIEENGSFESRIFTGFDSGGYFEYRGFRNLYIDARPELFTSEFTDSKHILADYAVFCASRSVDPLYNKNISYESIEEWLQDYDFDYIVTGVYETFLRGYLTGTDEYRLVESCNGQYFCLWEKV